MRSTCVAMMPFKLLQYRLDPLVELALGQRTYLGRGDLPVFEQDHRRNPAHPVFHRGLGVLVDVDLGYGQFASHVGGQVFEKRTDHTARATPLCPEIDENRLARAEDRGVE